MLKYINKNLTTLFLKAKANKNLEKVFKQKKDNRLNIYSVISPLLDIIDEER